MSKQLMETSRKVFFQIFITSFLFTYLVMNIIERDWVFIFLDSFGVMCGTWNIYRLERNR